MSNRIIKDAVDMAKSLQDFVDSINTYRFTMDDINDISFFRPDINDTISQINCWLNNDTASEDDNPILEISEPIEINNPDDDTKILDVSDDIVEEVVERNVKMTKDDYNDLGYFLATECDGDTLTEAKTKAYAKFPRFIKQSISRFTSKRTFAKDSDMFFTIEDGKIKAVEGHPIPLADFEIQKIIESIKDKDKFYSIIGNMSEDLWQHILLALYHSGGNVGSLYESKPDMTGAELVDIETVKRAAVYGGVFTTELTHFDMTILISDAISRVGKKKIARISNYVKKHWGIGNLRPETVFGVLNKKDFPEICDKFFR